MPGCVLRAFGETFDVDAFLAGSPFRPCAVFHRGQPRTPGSLRVSERSGFNLEVSAEGGDCVPAQVRDATAFVAANRPELARLAYWPGVEAVTLDFGWDFPCERAAGQYNYFPPALLSECGALGVGIMVSVYGVSGVDAEHDA